VHPNTDLHRVLPDCDFVCIVVPAMPETRHMIGARELELMKRTAFLLNISRGSLVDEAALICALRAGAIAGAGLDVFEQEPPVPDNPLWSMPNVIMTPHISGMMLENAARVAALFAENLGLYRAGQPLRNIVRLERGY
jgi:phosphoglycerate dehydrogenase-like enzyme